MVFLQAAIHPDRRYATIEAVEDSRLILCTSPELLAEVRDVLTRPALMAKFSELTHDRVAQFLDRINLIAMAFPNVRKAFSWPQHPDDDQLFNLAIESKADFMVTWENRLLQLGTDTTPSAVELRTLAPRLSIVTPAQLAATLKPTN
jgi:putative PIN family toxin of toxin-antitoxin system